MKNNAPKNINKIFQLKKQSDKNKQINKNH